MSPFLKRQGETWAIITNKVWEELLQRGLAAVTKPTTSYTMVMKRIDQLWKNNSKIITKFSKEKYVNLPFTQVQLGFETLKRKRSNGEPVLKSNPISSDGVGGGPPEPCVVTSYPTLRSNSETVLNENGTGRGEVRGLETSYPTKVPSRKISKIKPRKAVHGFCGSTNRKKT